uniref:Uncharacterized protein n=1 Tax=uncultured Thiotrichaceae bacterium TaxID=298394 RepID=A0A6S6SM13_9GAMM|nr:MAG: Unknown protein [uncultured Thiotrichaceae bacterium]
MGSGLKLLVGGVILGLMAVFAFIGVKSLIDDKSAGGNQQAQQQIQQSVQAPPITQADDTSQTLADQAAQQPADTTQLTSTEPAQQDPDTATQTAEQNTAAPAQQDQNATTQIPAQQPEQVTQSTKEEEKLDMQLIDEYGGLQLTLSDPASPGGKVQGQFIIRDVQDQEVANIKDADTASFDLSPGIYEVTVIAQGKKSARMVKITTGEFVTENFTLPASAPVQPTQTVQQAQQPAQNQQQAANTGKLSIAVQAATTKAPLKSNIYVQLPNGQHIAKKNYADVAEFILKAGTYRVTVKAQGKVDIVRTIGIQPNANVNQVFAMQSPASKAPAKPQPPAEGTLAMAFRAPNARNKGRFVVRDQSGNRVKRMRGVSNAEVKLKPGRYNVTAVYRGARLNKPVDVFQGKTSNITFNVNEFPRDVVQPAQNQNQPAQQQQVQVPAQRGVLQLIAVSPNGQPLKVNFMVSTLNGQRLKAANNVSVTEVTMTPQDVLVDISYEEMRGQERIKVKPGEPTVFTFTITPNNTNVAAPINRPQPQAPTSLEGMLLERLQQEIFKRTN